MNRATSATGWARNPDGALGYTWNPITGCLNHTPEGLCLGGMFPCYAYKLANGRLKARYLSNNVIAPFADGIRGAEFKARNNPFYPRFWQDRLNEPLYGNPKGIFVCDMGELFGDWLPEGWADEVFHTINRSPQHRFYLLTKQPQNLIKFSPFPENCWAGVTLTNIEQHLALFASGFKYIEAKIKYVSLEPLLENLYFHPDDIKTLGINWVIIGAQTKPYKPPKIEWVEEIVRACDDAGIPVFLKDNLEPLLEKAIMTYSHTLYWRDGYYTCPDHPNVELYLRKEMPK